MDQQEIIREFMSQNGRKGGKNLLENRGKNHFREMARLSAEVRRNKKKKAVDKTVLTEKQTAC